MAPTHHLTWEGLPVWSEIASGLWMGGTAPHDEYPEIRQWPAITRESFDTVVTAYSFASPVDSYVKEIRLGFHDYYDLDVDLADLGWAVVTAHADWRAGRRVLIRCQAGRNRSGLITALVLMRDGMAADEAISAIRLERSRYALANPTYVDWLRTEAEAFLAELPAPMSSICHSSPRGTSSLAA